MSKIKIRSLSIKNFKGIKELEIAFDEKQTNIKGANGTGKSSVMDAFTWLLFGKDSQDRKDFDIKNTVSTELNRQDHEVTGVLDIDGRHETLKHIYREKWVKKQGSKTPEMTGHEHLYFWNDVPLQAGEYKAKVDSILNESIFKLITNALYFNSLKWTERRSIIEGLAGHISDAEIIDRLITTQNKTEYGNLINILNSGKSIEEYQKQIAARKKIVKTSLDEIKPRIDENLKQLPEDIDLTEVEKRIAMLKSDLEGIDKIIADRSLATQSVFEQIQKKQKQLHQFQTEANTISFSFKQDIMNAENARLSKIRSLKSRVDSIQESLTSKKALIESKNQVTTRINSEMDELRAGWERDKAREFKYDESKFSCPTCNRDFETSDIEESKRIMKDNFDAETARLLEIVNQKGLKLKQEKTDNDELIAKLSIQIADLEKELQLALSEYNEANGAMAQDPQNRYENILKTDPVYQELQGKINQLSDEISQTQKPEVDVSDLQPQKQAINAEIDTLKSQLSVKDRRKEILSRIDVLKSQENTLSDELVSIEGSEYTISEFLRAKIDFIEAKTNGLFKYVSFKMFENLLNGGSEPTCITIYKGVPWDTLNTAARINAGIDIINTLSRFHNVTAPIFLDNRESTTHVIDTESQLINLIVSPVHNSLTIE